MNTPTHFLVNYSLGRLLRLKERYHVRMSSIVWGSLAPDIMLYLLSVGAAIYYPLFRGWTMGQGLDYAFDTLFFQNGWWIFLHNLFQAPILLIATIAICGYILRATRNTPEEHSRARVISLWILFFSISALLHTVLDIFTHHDDGPLLLYPFNMTVRFISPVSYWDADHYGVQFAIFEGLLNLVCVGYLIYLRIARRRRAK